MNESTAEAIHRENVYKCEYRRWVAKLSPGKRAKLKAAGLMEPMIEGKGKHNANDTQPEDIPTFSVKPDMAHAIDSVLDSWLEFAHKMPVKDAVEYCYKMHSDIMGREKKTELARVLTKAVNFLMTQSNAKLAAIGISFAAGLPYLNGRTMTEAAIHCGCTRQAISKIVNAAADALELPRSQYMKSAETREIYRERAKEVHKRKGEIR